MQSREQVIKKIWELGLIQRGDFTLKSGGQSSVYLDLRQMVSTPELMGLVASEVSRHAWIERADRIAGVPQGALPLASITSHIASKPALMIRKEKKSHGLGKQIEGVYQTGDRVILIEDVITSGESVIETIRILRAEGLVVSGVLAVIDRGQGGLNRIRELQVPCDSLYTLDEILEFRSPSRDHSSEVFSSNRSSVSSRICAALDTPTWSEALDWVRRLHERKQIQAVKVHADLYPDFDLRRARDLRDYCDQHGLLLVEDRKLADIGSVMSRQLHDGPQKISSWAHLVTVHACAGLESLRALADSCLKTKTGILLVTDLSSSGQLLNPDYQRQALRMSAELFPVIQGIVSQTHRPLHLEQKLWMPGISLSSDRRTDSQGQTYRTLESIPEAVRPDYAIVGRSLLERFSQSAS